MTIEEFKQSLSVIKKQYEQSKNDLIVIFANDNNPYKIGDIIEDHYHTIQIEKLFPQSDCRGFGTMKFFGVELKKDLTPKKRQSNVIMYQEDIKRSH